MDLETARQTLDRAALRGPMRLLLNRPVAEILDWDTQPIGHAVVYTETRSLFRVAGHATDAGRIIPWALVLKVHRSPDGARYPSARDEGIRRPYAEDWAAEPQAYESGLLADLPGIVAPRCFGVEEQSDGAVWIWLEEIFEEVGPVWPLERYGVAARHLGRFNGAYLAGRALPEAWWLSRGRHGPREAGGYVTRAAATAVERDDIWEHPLVRRAYPVPVAERLRRLLAEDDLLYAALRRLPPTLCHHDFFRTNLFARHDALGSDETVAVDWEFVGIGRIGEELGPSVGSTIAWFEFPAERARDLGETIFEGYLTGLRDAGWRGNADLARLGYLITAARMAPTICGTGLRLMVDESLWEQYRRVWGRSIDEFGHQWSLLAYFLADLADEARRCVALV